jgi:succinate dehydrogenase/fumarate reductase cytochrome b subunit
MTKKEAITPFLNIYRPRSSSMLSIYQRISGVIIAAVLISILSVKKHSIVFGTYYGIYKVIYFVVKGAELSVNIGIVVVIYMIVLHFCFGMRYIYWARRGGFDKDPATIMLYKYTLRDYFIMCMGKLLLFQVIWTYIIY